MTPDRCFQSPRRRQATRRTRNRFYGFWLATALLASPTLGQSPETQLVAPTDGSYFALDEPIDLIAVASGPEVVEVEFLLYGSSLGTATAEPFELTLDGLPEGLHVLRSRVRDASGASTLSEPIAIRVAEPQRDALFVVKSLPPQRGDEVVAERLERYGYNLEIVTADAFTNGHDDDSDGSDSDSADSDSADSDSADSDSADSDNADSDSDDGSGGSSILDGKDLIVVASLVRPTAHLVSTLESAAVPVVTWNKRLYERLGMAQPKGFVNRQRFLDVGASASPLAAGLEGSVQIVSGRQRFSWGAPSSSAIVGATLFGDPGRPAIFGYEAGSEMLGTVAPARRLGFFLARKTARHLKQEGWLLFEAGLAWASGFEPLPDPFVRITAPGAGAEFAEGEGIPVVLEAGPEPVERIDLLLNGALVASTTEAGNVMLTGPPSGLYGLKARALIDGEVVFSFSVAITVGDPERDVLIVTGGAANADDLALRDRLSASGFAAATITAADLTLGDAEGATLIVLAPSVEDGQLGVDLRAVETPILCLEGTLYDDLGLTEADAFGTTGPTTELTMDVALGLLGGSPLSAGFDDTVEVFETPQALRWGTVGSNAIGVASSSTNGVERALFGFEQGAVAPFGPVPARRVGFFVVDGPLALTADGWELFDSAAAWAIGFDVQNQRPSVSLTAPAPGTSVAAGQSIRLAAEGSDPEGALASVVFYANGRAIGSASAPPYELQWTAPGTGLYQLTARAVDAAGATALSEPVSIVVGAPAVATLLVVGDAQNPTSGDSAFQTRLQALGLQVERATAGQVSAGAAVGKALVAISSSVDVASVDPDFAQVAVPLVSWNAELYPALGWTDSEPQADFGSTDQQLELELAAGALLAPGFGESIVFTTAPATYSWGRPAATAVIEATLASAEPAIFGYETGAEMVTASAAARRLALPLGGETTELTRLGGLTVDQAVAWALGSQVPVVDTVAPSLTIVSPTSGIWTDPTFEDLQAGVLVEYSDAGVGIDLSTVQVTFRNLRAETAFELVDLCTVGPARATCPLPLLGAGEFEVAAEVADLAGNAGRAAVQVTIELTSDQLPPQVMLTSPADSAFLAEPSLSVAGSVSDDGDLASFHVNGVSVELVNGTFDHLVTPLFEGENELIVLAQDFAGRSTTVTRTVTVDTVAPELLLEEPTGDVLVTAATIRVRGRAIDGFLDGVTVGGVALTLDDDGRFDQEVALEPGSNALEIVARDLAGNQSSALIAVFRSAPTAIALTSPTEGLVTPDDAVTVTGMVTAGAVSVLVGGILAEVVGETFTVSTYELHEGTNIITAVATDELGVSTTSTVRIFRDSEPPVLTFLSPSQGESIAAPTVAVTGVVQDLGNAPVPAPTVTVAGQPAEVSGGTFRAVVPLAVGLNALPVESIDAAGNLATATLTVERQDLTGQPVLVQLSGDGQVASAGTPLPAPLVVELRQADGTPATGRRVIFEVAGSDGRLTGAGAARARVVETDAQGRAAVGWTLGSRAGLYDRVTATAVGFMGTATFGARAEVGAPAELYIDSGNYQTGAVGEQLPFPLRVAVTDGFQNPVAGAEVRFEVIEGGGLIDDASTVTLTTGADGRIGAALTLGDMEMREGNTVRAELVGSPAAAPAYFLATGLVPGPELATAVRGLVLDNADLPVPGVSISIDGSPHTAITDEQGQFELSPAPVGHVHLVADGSTTPRPGDWPKLAFEMVTVSGRINAMDRPIYILPVRTSEGLTVGPTTGGTLTLPDVPGLELAVEPGAATFSDGSQSGVVSVTLVHADKVPMAPNYGQQPRLVLTVQPPSVSFDPPARLTLPNVSGLPPGAVGDVYSFRHDLGEFVAIGPGSVSDDGSVLVTGDGLGLRAGGWHHAPPQPQKRPKTDGCGGCPECKRCDSGSCRFIGNSQPCDDGMFCTTDDKCDLLNGCVGTPRPERVDSRIDIKGDLLERVNQALDAFDRGINNIAPCKAQVGDISLTGRLESVEVCCEDTDTLPLKARGTAFASASLGLNRCILPGAGFAIGSAVKFGVFFTVQVQPRLQASASSNPCAGPPKCPFGLSGQLKAKYVVELGGMLVIGGGGTPPDDPDGNLPGLLSVSVYGRNEGQPTLAFDCMGFDGSVPIGPFQVIANVGVAGGFSIQRIFEIPNSRWEFAP